MSVATFIPKIWSARILENLEKTMVYANLMNRDYEGEISKYGDTVHINTIGPVTVNDYVKGTPMADPEDISTTETTITIDQAKSFNFTIDDIDKAQARASVMAGATGNAGYAFADKADQYIAGLMKAGTIVSGLGTDVAPLVITADNAYATLVTIRTAMDKANVPKAGRWVVMPPEFEGFMLLDSRFASAVSRTSEKSLENGAIASAAGFDIYVSNNVPNTAGAKYKVIASTNISGTYAEQIVDTEAFRSQTNFADVVRGLHLYGAKVTRPEAIAVATCNFTA